MSTGSGNAGSVPKNGASDAGYIDFAGGLQLSNSPSIPKKGEGIPLGHGIRTIGGGKGFVEGGPNNGFVSGNSQHNPKAFSGRFE
jgi:hypothetical protein